MLFALDLPRPLHLPFRESVQASVTARPRKGRDFDMSDNIVTTTDCPAGNARGDSEG
jgi:hypothetical protein